MTLGCGQAQVRNEHSAADVPAFVTAKEGDRFTTGDLLNHLRTELWAKGLGSNFSGFVKKEHQTKSRRNTSNTLSSALFYSRR
jgi:hypothetical protein